ncbi:hypothetical protein [Paenibacillus alkalitolerans]|uniref:hypothetical protein n=1 Tax=Paenibacillus alkalitolerans TaxID=2799335 RepID=UPI0018F2A011|nr:hypothetical protein [Paenibacillus alkalitolerans]
MNKKTGLTMFLLPLFLAASVLTAGTAGAAVSVSATTKKALDKTIASADTEMKNKLTKQFGHFLNLQEQERAGDARNKTIHYKNEDTEIAVRKLMYQIDSGKIKNLEQAVKQARDRHQPLFDMYKSLNQQISVAKSLGGKELASALNAQAKALKVPVQLARQDIKAKTTLLSTAKKERSAKIKRVRNILADIKPIDVKIKAERSTESIYKKNVSTEWSYFTQSVKKNDPKATSSSLTSLIAKSNQIVEQKRKIYEHEKKISDILAKAKMQIGS